MRVTGPHTLAAGRPGFGDRGDTIWCRNQPRQNIPVTLPSLLCPSPPLTFPWQQCEIVDCWATFLRWQFAWMSKWNISPQADPQYLKGELGTSSQQLCGLICKCISGCLWSTQEELEQSQKVCVFVWSRTCSTVRTNSPISLKRGDTLWRLSLLPHTTAVLDEDQVVFRFRLWKLAGQHYVLKDLTKIDVQEVLKFG